MGRTTSIFSVSFFTVIISIRIALEFDIFIFFREAATADHNYFLTPVGATSDKLVGSNSRVQTSQQLQKPNELDTNVETSADTSTNTPPDESTFRDTGTNLA